LSFVTKGVDRGSSRLIAVLGNARRILYMSKGVPHVGGSIIHHVLLEIFFSGLMAKG
jgi:hypothetical protein